VLGDIYLFYARQGSFASAFGSGYLGGVIHAAVEVGNTEFSNFHCPLLLEANIIWKKVAIFPLSFHKNTPFEVWRLKDLWQDEFDTFKALNWGFQQVGKTYDILQLVGIYFKRKLDSPNKYICSELVYKFYLAGGIRLCEWANPAFIVPTHFQYDEKLQKMAEGMVSSDGNIIIEKGNKSL
jgi:hypothetical protein